MDDDDRQADIGDDRMTAIADGHRQSRIFLDQAIGNLIEIADGTTEVKRTYQAAGTITRKDVVRNPDGSVWLDGKGRPASCLALAFPDRPAGELVLVGKLTIRRPPDRDANIYLLDRVMGRPCPEPESHPAGQSLRRALIEADQLMKDYVDPDDSPGVPPADRPGGIAGPAEPEPDGDQGDDDPIPESDDPGD